MNHNLFSILIPVYNVEKYLAECLESVVNQTYQVWEAILIDDGSTDTSGIICDAYAQKDSRIHVYHQPNKGLMMTRKNGILHASGEYCLFLDSDDYYDITLLEQVECYLQKSPCDMLIFNKHVLYKEKCVQSAFIEDRGDNVWNNKQAIKELVRTNNIVSIWTKVVKRKLILPHLEEIYIEVNYAEDLLQSFFFMYYAETIGILHSSLYYYRIRKSSLIHQMSLERVEETLQVKAKVMQLMQVHGFLDAENKTAFSINILNDFMESIYRLNNEKKQKNVILQELSALFHNELVTNILNPEIYSNITYYNRFRAHLFAKEQYKQLIFVDRWIIRVQNLLCRMQGRTVFE